MVRWFWHNAVRSTKGWTRFHWRSWKLFLMSIPLSLFNNRDFDSPLITSIDEETGEVKIDGETTITYKKDYWL